MDAEHRTETRRPSADRIPHGQLRLLNTLEHPEWKLDESTRAVGLRGVAKARAALHAARPADTDVPPAAAATASSHHSNAA